MTLFNKINVRNISEPKRLNLFNCSRFRFTVAISHVRNIIQIYISPKWWDKLIVVYVLLIMHQLDWVWLGAKHPLSLRTKSIVKRDAMEFLLMLTKREHYNCYIVLYLTLKLTLPLSKHFFRYKFVKANSKYNTNNKPNSWNLNWSRHNIVMFLCYISHCNNLIISVFTHWILKLSNKLNQEKINYNFNIYKLK